MSYRNWSGARRATAAVMTTLGLAVPAAPAFAEQERGSAIPGAASTTPRPAVSTVKPAKPSTTRKVGDDPTRPSSAIPTGAETTRLGSTTTRGADRNDVERREALAKLDDALRQLRSASAGSADPTLAALAAKLEALRAQLVAGGSVRGEELSRLLSTVREALARSNKPTSSSRPDEGAAEHPAARALREQIERIKASDLDDSVKQRLIAVLLAAKDHVRGDSDTSEESEAARQKLAQERHDRMSDMSRRLTALANEVEAFIDRAAASGAGADAVAEARAKLARARALLASADGVDDLRGAWRLLREARLALLPPR